jgi:hypothetical protein
MYITKMIEQTFGLLEIPAGTLIFHSNTYLGADLLVTEPLGGPMTMPFVKRYGDSEATQSRRIFCNLAMTPTFLVKGNFASSVSIYVVNTTLRLIKLPMIMRGRRYAYLKDALGFSEAATFKNYTGVRDVDGLYMLTSVDKTPLVETEAELRWMNMSQMPVEARQACFPEVALFGGSNKLTKIGQVDLLDPNHIDTPRAAGEFRTRLLAVGKAAFDQRTAENEASGDKTIKPKAAAVNAMNVEIWSFMGGEDGKLEYMTDRINDTLTKIRRDWSGTIVQDRNFTLTPGPPDRSASDQGYWRVPEYKTIPGNAGPPPVPPKYIIDIIPSREPFPHPVAEPPAPPQIDEDVADQEHENFQIAAIAELDADEDGAFHFGPLPGPAPGTGVVYNAPPVAAPVAAPVVAPVVAPVPAPAPGHPLLLQDQPLSPQLVVASLAQVQELNDRIQRTIGQDLAANFTLTGIKERNRLVAERYLLAAQQEINTINARIAQGDPTAPQALAIAQEILRYAQEIYRITVLVVRFLGGRRATPRARSKKRTYRQSR